MDSAESIIITEDGSQTIVSSRFKERYHSIYGAMTESQVVFIDAGLEKVTERDPIRVLEMGFGTGLNALMTWEYADVNQRAIEYVGYEKFPISIEMAGNLEYGSHFKSDKEFLSLHTSESSKQIILSKFFTFEKRHEDILKLKNQSYFDLIYFDAFAPAAQEELWTTDIFQLLYNSLSKDGSLVTYCAKGQVKRNMRAAGFEVIGLPGPPGKREMTKAIKR